MYLARAEEDTTRMSKFVNARLNDSGLVLLASSATFLDISILTLVNA